MKIRSLACKASLFLCLFVGHLLFAQEGFVRTKEGSPILNKKQLINSCLSSLHKDLGNSTAVQICKCQVEKLDRYFTKSQYKKFTHSGIIDIAALVNEDSAINKQIQLCFTNSGKTILLQAEGFEEEYIARCKQSIKENTERQIDESKLTNFCNCQLSMVKTRKLTDAEMATLSNPNSLLFYEIMYKCGDPFVDQESTTANWNATLANDVNGPAADTITVLNMNGMTYLKMKTGSLIQFWLFDTGASDLLINKEMEETLKQEGVITGSSYLGTGEYEMANGIIDTCRKYKINNVRLGSYTLNNIVIAVSDKGKRIIVGKSVLNKFSNWLIDNKNSTLILSK